MTGVQIVWGFIMHDEICQMEQIFQFTQDYAIYADLWPEPLSGPERWTQVNYMIIEMTWGKWGESHNAGSSRKQFSLFIVSLVCL